MPIIRTPKPDSYTLINNSVFSDSDPLSWDAIGLLCYLLSKPDNWTVSPTALANTQRCGINKIHNLLKELKQSGFVAGKKNRNGTLDYYVFDSKQSETSDLMPHHEKPNQEKPNQEKPNQEKPNQEKPNQEKPNQDLETLINTDNKQLLKEKVNTDYLVITDKEVITEREDAIASRAQINKKSVFKKPTVEEVTEFCAEHALTIKPDMFIDYYESNGWMVGKSKMKNWQATLRNWQRRENENKQPLRSTKPYKERNIGTYQTTQATNGSVVIDNDTQNIVSVQPQQLAKKDPSKVNFFENRRTA